MDMKRIAIIFQNRKVTYDELDKEVYKRICYLSTINISNGIIGLLFTRNVEYIYWMLAILKSKLCFLPIDINASAEKISFIINNSCINTVISDTERTLEIENYIDINKISDYPSKENNMRFCSELAYIMYTSGTTGMPKGVMISKKALAFFLKNFLKNKIVSSDIFLANTTFVFDISIVELLLPLKYGASLYMTDDKEQKNPKLIINLILNYKFDWVQLTPSYLMMLLKFQGSMNSLNSIKNLLIGGEKVPNSLAKLLTNNVESNIYNVYGPTETTIWTHIGNLKDDFVNVGKAIEGVTEYILNDNLEIVEKGKLWIGGETLSKGYINNLALTKEKFIHWNGVQIYNTGDIASRKEGKLLIWGRVDNQIKVDGKRIEIEEIEALIIDTLDISQCIVINYLGTLCVVLTDKNISLEEINTKMSKKIDTTFLPKKVVYIEKIPMLNSGKMDRRKVRDIVMEKFDAKKRVMEILKEFTTIQIDNSTLMTDLGLSSIEYVTLIVKVEKTLNIEFDDSALVISKFCLVEDFINYAYDAVS